jgi:hypothetical protein
VPTKLESVAVRSCSITKKCDRWSFLQLGVPVVCYRGFHCDYPGWLAAALLPQNHLQIGFPLRPCIYNCNQYSVLQAARSGNAMIVRGVALSSHEIIYHSLPVCMDYLFRGVLSSTFAVQDRSVVLVRVLCTKGHVVVRSPNFGMGSYDRATLPSGRPPLLTDHPCQTFYLTVSIAALLSLSVFTRTT